MLILYLHDKTQALVSNSAVLYGNVAFSILKSGSHPPKKFTLFISMKALKKWWKMIFISS